jgi:hypothetical protein
VAQFEGGLGDLVSTSNSPKQTACQHSSPSGSSSSSLPALSSSSCKQNAAPSSLFSGPSAFLGPTSFSAVFHDNRDNFEPVSSDLPTSVETETAVQSHDRVIDEPRIHSDLIKLGIKVLLKIPNETACNVIFSRHTNPNDGWIRLAGKRLSNSIWATFGRVLARRDNRELEALVQLICGNTNSELREEADPLKWFESFSGCNLRWEAIGVLFTYWSFGALSSAEGDAIFTSASGSRKERREMMIELKECATSCIAFCSHTDHGNAFLVYLLYKHSLLESMISGDASECALSMIL